MSAVVPLLEAQADVAGINGKEKLGPRKYGTRCRSAPRRAQSSSPERQRNTRQVNVTSPTAANSSPQCSPASLQTAQARC